MTIEGVVMTRIRNSTHLRRHNLRVTFKEILKNQPISKSEIARILRVNSSTIAQILDPFIERNIIEEVKSGVSNGGRPPILLRINANSNFYVAIDLSGYDVRIALVDSSFQIIQVTSAALSKDLVSSLQTIADRILLLIYDSGIQISKVLGCCIAVSGVFDKSTGRVLTSIIHGLDEVRLLDFFERLPFPVYVENDANLSAVGEFMKVKREISNLIYVHLGHGIGGGIILEQRVLTGERGFSGEIGQLVYSVKPIFRTTGEIYEEIRPFLGRGKPLNESLIEKLETLLVTLIINMVGILDISNIIIGGQYAEIPDKSLVRIEKEVRESFDNIEIVVKKSDTTIDSILVGASQFLMEELLIQ